MVEVSDDQHRILGIDQFDHRVHTLNKWIKSRGEAALALGVEINGIANYMRKSSIFIHRTMSSFFVPCRRVLDAGLKSDSKMKMGRKVYMQVARRLPAEYKAKFGVPQHNISSRFGAS